MGIKDNIALQVKVAELQVQLKEAHARIAELESRRVEYVDNPAHIEMIKTLQEKLRGMNG